MAEAPQHSSSIRATAPPVVAPLPELPAAEGAEPYRPLSLLAVAGFLLAALYAVWVTVGGLALFAQFHATLLKMLLVLVPLGGVLLALMVGIRAPLGIAAFTGKALVGTATVVGLGSLIAYSGTNPWLLPELMWFEVLAAILICWVARARIQASENTLSGQALAGWGLSLGLFFGIGYSVYLGANLLAVRWQARACAEDFLTQLQKGDQMQAFLLSLPPGSRPATQSNLRETIEIKYNTPSAGAPNGAFSGFCRTDLVRTVMLNGADGTFEPGSVNWDHEKEAYHVGMKYKISGPAGTYDAQLVALGMATAGSGRRQWHIDMNQSALNFKPPSTDEGFALLISGREASTFATNWLKKLISRSLDDAYLDTVAPDEREKQSKDRNGKTYLQGRQAFAKGLVLDDKDLWPKPKKDTPIEDMVQNMFKIFAGTLTAYNPAVEVPIANVPTLIVKGDQAMVTVVGYIVFRDTSGPRYSMECEIDVETPISDSPVESKMRIRTIRLARCRSVAKAAPNARGGMGQ